LLVAFQRHVETGKAEGFLPICIYGLALHALVPQC
jgi:hypothetical protein